MTLCMLQRRLEYNDTILLTFDSQCTMPEINMYQPTPSYIAKTIEEAQMSPHC